jgi:hypothetical protein
VKIISMWFNVVDLARLREAMADFDGRAAGLGIEVVASPYMPRGYVVSTLADGSVRQLYLQGLEVVPC